MELLILNDIQKSYEQKDILKNINLTVNEGEFFTFLGPSGCGKTTLLRIIAGFIIPDSGSVKFNNTIITNISAEKRDIGMVFQNYALFPFLNVFDNIAYGLKIRKENKSIIVQQVKKYLRLVNLEGFENRIISELSGGEQQRVALARSLVLEPKLLLLDEPLSNLDARLRDKMRAELKEIQRKLGITTIFVTHDQSEALSMSDRIAVFDNGNCLQVGTPKEIYSEPANLFVANFIGDMNILKADITNKKAIITPKITLDLNQDTDDNHILIRPQDIIIKDHPESCRNIVEGIINKINLNGNILEYIVTTDSIELKVIKLNMFTVNCNYNVGQKVYLEINPNCIRTLKD